MKSKKLFFLFCILLSLVGTKVSAYDIEVKNANGVIIYYNYINDGKELEVTFREASKHDTYSGSVVIPDEVTYMSITRKVTSIGENAFLSCLYLRSVTIPKSVTSIGKSAFGYCWSLATITIPNSVTSIEESAFSSCTGLTSVTIPNSITSIKERTFSYCSGLTSITIPNSVTSIGRNAFDGCSGLISVTIPNSVTSIGYRAFYGSDLSKVISKIENPSLISNSTFTDYTFYHAKLYVPAGTIEKYKSTDGWKKFVYIEEGTGSDTPTESKKCEKPTISYSKGKLTFNCSTDGAICQYTITDSDINSGSSNEVQLRVTYNISVYATKSGYDNSETATATLCWIDVAPKTEGITNGVASVRAMPVMIQSQGGVLNITGAPEGSVINVYDLSGKKVDSAISSSEKTSIPTNLKSGEIGIVKIGDKSIKVVMQ